MQLVSFAVHLSQFNIKISAHVARLPDSVLVKNFPSIAGDKHQMNRHQENTVSSPTNIGFFVTGQSVMAAIKRL